MPVPEGVPGCVIEPEHGRALFAKVPLGGGDLFFWRITIEDSLVNAVRSW